MTGTGIDGLGPTFCDECKTKPDTSIRGENHPICRHHYDWLQAWFREHPERKLGWEGGWANRVYGWVEQINETQDATGEPGDHDKLYTYRTPSVLQERGELSMPSALLMHRMRETHFGKGLREELPDELYRIPR